MNLLFQSTSGIIIAFAFTTTILTPFAVAQSKPVPANYPTAVQCQAAITRKVKSAYAGIDTVTYDTSTTTAYFISNAEEGIRGKGQFRQTNNWKSFNYDCKVNIRTGTVTTATYSLITGQTSKPASPDSPSVSQCHAAISGKIKQSYAGVEKVIYDSSKITTYFISNAEEGVKGNGQFFQGSSWNNFTYDCQVNIRNGTITSTTYTLYR
jgi:hypothetical protein